MKFLVCCDPRAYRDSKTDVLVTLEAAARDFELWIATPSDIVEEEGGQEVRVRQACPNREIVELLDNPSQKRPWSSFDLVFDRALKPFPGRYQQALSKASSQVGFVNDPKGIEVQHADLRFMLDRAAAFLPDAVILSHGKALDAYLKRYGQAVLKRGNSSGGQGVFRIRSVGPNYELDNIRLGTINYPSPVAAFDAARQEDEHLLAMRFLPRVSEGDKRVIVVDGMIYGAYLRRNQGSWIQNVSSGAHTSLSEVTDEERSAIAATAPLYGKAGLRILGYDFLLDADGRSLISEINAGNIGGIARIGQLGGPDCLEQFHRWLRALSVRLQKAPVELGPKNGTEQTLRR